MNRLIVVSNHAAPVAKGQGTAGSLAVSMFNTLHETGDIRFGWSGGIATTASHELNIITKGNITYAAAGLNCKNYDQYYRGSANATLWSIFRYRVGLSHYEYQEYHGYRHVNVQFTCQLKALVQPDDILWAHDYHLVFFVAERHVLGFTNRIGFLPHTPSPSPGVLTTTPPHEDLMCALCVHDLAGFRTETDHVAFYDHIKREMRSYIKQEGQNGLVHAYDHMLRAETHPIGVHPDEIVQQTKTSLVWRNPFVQHASVYGERIAPQGQGQGQQPTKLIVSVDRPDYSKGLPERLRVSGQLLDDFPDHHRHMTFIQIAPTSRQDVQSYQQIRQRSEAESGHVNGKHPGLDRTPIRYTNKQYERCVLTAPLHSSQIGYVTPPCDGMNFVAKEYVVTQDPEDPGALVLSCLAGAAHELDAALTANPYDTCGITEVLNRALMMPLGECKARYAHMMDRLRVANLAIWREHFAVDLRDALPQQSGACAASTRYTLGGPR